MYDVRLPEVQAMTESAVSELLRTLPDSPRTKDTESQRKSSPAADDTDSSTRSSGLVRFSTSSKTAGCKMTVPWKQIKRDLVSGPERPDREATLLLQLFEHNNEEHPGSLVTFTQALLWMTSEVPPRMLSCSYPIEISESAEVFGRTRWRLQRYARRAKAGKLTWTDAVHQLLEKGHTDTPEFFGGNTTDSSLSERIRAQGPLPHDHDFHKLTEMEQAQGRSPPAPSPAG